MNILKGCQPEKVFYFFEEICAVPHGSGNTAKISAFCENFAKSRGLECYRDEVNNVIIKKPGTIGYEDHPPVIIQGHMDMVCVAEPGIEIDFENEPIRLNTDGEFVFADGTSLGGDDGIAVAYALALLDSDEVVHPPLEIVLTVDEETNMGGASYIDTSSLKARSLINIDSETEGVLTIGCAGGSKGTVTLFLERDKMSGTLVGISVKGLKGGHSGTEIDKGRANAAVLIARLCKRISDVKNIRLCSFTGGSKENAIADNACVSFICSDTDYDEIAQIVNYYSKQVKQNFYANDPDIVFSLSNKTVLDYCCYSSSSTKTAFELIYTLPNGVQEMSSDIEGFVETSLNLGVAEISDGVLTLHYSIRSNDNSKRVVLEKTLSDIAKRFGAEFTASSSYPAWRSEPDCDLVSTMRRVYKKLYNSDVKVERIHAGLECGILSAKIDGLECVSIGPDIYDIHSPNERLSVASTARTWEYLLEVLKSL